MPASVANVRDTAADPPREQKRGWPLERILFLLAGTMTALSAILSAAVSPWFLLLTGFVAVNQLLFATVGDCPASLILRHGFGVERAAAR
ncbi:MAG: YgaP family membrane protein [Solirubrobacterales bacterium]